MIIKILATRVAESAMHPRKENDVQPGLTEEYILCIPPRIRVDKTLKNRVIDSG